MDGMFFDGVFSNLESQHSQVLQRNTKTYSEGKIAPASRKKVTEILHREYKIHVELLNA